MERPIIEFNDFTFQYNAQAEPTIYNIDLKISKGEKILIAGPSGCGKSTIVNCINGLIPHTYKGTSSGSLKVNGIETADLSVAKLSETVGTVLQDSDAQFVGMTVLEDIAFALENECMVKADMVERVQNAATIVDIGEFMKYAPSSLSGGQKQRVAIAGILVDDVSVMIFDEPLANLDPATGKKAMELIDEVQAKTGCAVVIVEHRLEDVLHCHVDRVVVMSDGRIIYDGSAAKLLTMDILEVNGIREPLYITALKYAGVKITEEMLPDSIRTITLNDDDIKKVHDWYELDPVKEREVFEDSFLKLEGVRFGYDDRPLTLKGVDIDIKKGELIALVGKNGAGKTTLSKVVCGFEKGYEGDITLKGEDIRDLSIKERADIIGYVMQNPNKMISKTMIYDEVALGLRTRNVDEDTIRERVESVLKVCGLFEFRNWPISALSYGQRKRVTIASILVLDPDMLILDEPTAGQDYRHYTDIMEFLLELHKRGLTIMMITHDMHLMLEYSTRSIVFFDGQVIANDTSANILTDKDIIQRASLKETSLYDLAIMCDIADPSGFVQHFIDYERTIR